MSYVRVDQIQDKNGDHAINVADIASATTLNTETAKKLNLTGGTLTGPLIASREPQNALEVGTKSYIDTKAAGVLPSPTGHNNESLRLSSAGTLEYFDGGQKIGDVLFTTRTPNSSYVLPDTVYTQAAYPALFAQVGIQGEKNDLSTFSQVNIGFNTNGSVYDCAAGQNGVMIAVGMSSSSGTTTNGWAFKSVDGGATWAPLAALTGLDALQTINTDLAGVWLATSRVTAGKYYRSVDNGVTWTPITGGFPGTSGAPSNTVLTTNRTGTWLAAAQSGQTYVDKSTDNGLTWTAVQTAPYTTAAITTVSNDFAGTWYGVVGSSLYRSEDAGNTWRFVYQNSQQSVGLPSCGGSITAMTLGQLGFAISTDKGLTWKTMIVPGQVVVDPNGTVFCATYAGKIYRSTDAGETWNITALSQVAVTLWPKSLDANGNVMAQPSASVGAVQPTAGYWWRSARQFNYDTTTQFKVPYIKAPKGYKAYIKAKTGAEA